MKLKPIGLALSLVALMACEGILDIQEAELDPLAACSKYCTTVQAACTGADAVYATSAICLGVCNELSPGTTGDKRVNTIACREGNAVLAQDTNEPNVYCPTAGPTGDDSCGSNCDAYCSVMQSTCSGDFNDLYDSLAECLTECGDLPDLGAFKDSIQTGDSIQCRLYHLSAATLDAGVHCSHAAGIIKCVDEPGTGGGGGVGGAGSSSSAGGA